MSFAAWLDRHAAEAPERAALTHESGTLSYGALKRAVGALAHRLRHAHGIAPGDRVALLALNRPEYLVLLLACARLGAMLVPLNWRLAPPEHAFILRDSGARLLIHEPAFEATARLAAAQGCDGLSLPLDPGDGDVAADPGIGDATRVMIVYTSGTTGQPKGAVLTQGALRWNALNGIAAHDLSRADRVLTTIPLFHVGGLNIQTVPALHAGAHVFLHTRFDPAATLRAIAADRITVSVLVPTQLRALIEHADWPAADLSSLRVLATGSSVVPDHLIAPFLARGVPVINVYGATETAPIATALDPADAARKLGSCGKAARHCAVRVADDAGADVPAATRGEILVRGPNVFLEYWNNPAATREAFVDGWFRTGDIGHFDPEGYLWIDDRKKEVIISGGENVYPAEVEAVIDQLPGIAEAAVVARADARWGEVPVAVVVRRPGAALTAADVLAAFDGRLARYKCPRDVVFVDALPRTALGKVQKFKLREIV
jgi:fatty-acyl-CoA synthase